MPTDVEVGRSGWMFVTTPSGSTPRSQVTEIFTVRISQIRHGKVTTLLEPPNPATIESAGGKPYVGYAIAGDPNLAPNGARSG